MTQTQDKTYNGWTNDETWNVKLWIDNDRGSQEYWKEITEDVYKNAKKDKIFTKEERATLSLMEVLKDYFEENNPLPDFGVYTDLLSAALSEVNWREIAKSLINDEINNNYI